MFLVLYVLLTVGILLNRYLGDLFLVSLKKQQSFLYQRRCCKDSYISRLKPKTIFYRNYKNFDEEKFVKDVKEADFSFSNKLFSPL